MKKLSSLIVSLIFLLLTSFGWTYSVVTTDVLVVGGGCGGAAAAVQAGRMGVKVILVEETPWLGGMMSSAAVSCYDGNQGTLETGIYKDVNNKIIQYYGGNANAVKTGAWVSVFCFEPKAGNWAWQQLVSTTGNIQTYYNSTCISVIQSQNTIKGAVIVTSSGDTVEIRAHVTLDGTEYGDLLPLAGIPYRLGRDAKSTFGESAAEDTTDMLVQDLTYCAVFKDYGTPTTLIPQPPDYDASLYDGSFKEPCTDTTIHYHTLHTWASMISYGKLPNNKYMINWPFHGNDADVIPHEMTPYARQTALQRAKNITLGFLYYIQTNGHPQIGLATDEYETPDYLPHIPYVREARRMQGLVTYRQQDVVNRYDNNLPPLYKTSIAVGDYSIDHHHAIFVNDADNPYRNMGEHYPASQSPTIPYGTLIPEGKDGFMACDKNISASHIVNGSTRLQPIVMLTGQAAGAAAALSCQSSIQPRQVNVRQLQQVLLNYGSMLMPFKDVSSTYWAYQPIQRVSVAGALRARDITSSWLKSCYFDPSATMTYYDGALALRRALAVDVLTTQYIWDTTGISLTRDALAGAVWQLSGSPEPQTSTPYYTDVTAGMPLFKAIQYFRQLRCTQGWAENSQFLPSSVVKKEQLAVTIDKAFDPFNRLPITLSVDTPVQTTIQKMMARWSRHYDVTVENRIGNPPSWFTPSGDNCRDMAFNPTTRHLLISNDSTQSIHIMNSVDGSDLGRLDNTGLMGGYRNLMSLDVAADGVIYACNYDSTQFRIYQWANETATCSLAAQISLPSYAGRVVRAWGSGAETKLFVTSSESHIRFHVLTTGNGAQFGLSETVNLSSVTVGSYGIYGVGVESASSLLLKGSQSELYRVMKSGSSWQLSAVNNEGFVSGLGTSLVAQNMEDYMGSLIHLDAGPYLLSTGVSTTVNGALIYQWSENHPVLRGAALFPSTNPNTNLAGNVCYDPITATLYVMKTNNGMAAYDMTPFVGPTAAPLWNNLMD